MEYGCLYGLKGQKQPAQGSALGMLRTSYCALKGQKHCCQRVMLLPLQGTRGAALGYGLLALQAVLPKDYHNLRNL